MRITIGKKLISSFLAVAILLGLVSGLEYFFIHKMENSFADILDRRAVILVNAKDIQFSALAQMSAMRGYITNHDQSSIKSIETFNAALNDAVNKTLNIVTANEEKKR